MTGWMLTTAVVAALSLQHMMAGRDAAIAAAFLDQLIQAVSAGSLPGRCWQWHGGGTNQSTRPED
jgi:hypothetical protein